MHDKTTDDLLALLQWIADRHRYRVACGIRDGVGHADDCKAETEALHELTVRGYFGGAAHG